MTPADALCTGRQHERDVTGSISEDPIKSSTEDCCDRWTTIQVRAPDVLDERSLDEHDLSCARRAFSASIKLGLIDQHSSLRHGVDLHLIAQLLEGLKRLYVEYVDGLGWRVGILQDAVRDADRWTRRGRAREEGLEHEHAELEKIGWTSDNLQNDNTWVHVKKPVTAIKAVRASRYIGPDIGPVMRFASELASSLRSIVIANQRAIVERSARISNISSLLTERAELLPPGVQYADPMEFMGNIGLRLDQSGQRSQSSSESSWTDDSVSSVNEPTLAMTLDEMIADLTQSEAQRRHLRSRMVLLAEQYEEERLEREAAQRAFESRFRRRRRKLDKEIDRLSHYIEEGAQRALRDGLDIRQILALSEPETLTTQHMLRPAAGQPHLSENIERTLQDMIATTQQFEGVESDSREPLDSDINAEEDTLPATVASWLSTVE